MDKFELYMIDTIKVWSDKVRTEENDEVRWMEKNVLAELMGTLVRYEAYTNGITVDDDFYESDVPVDVA